MRSLNHLAKLSFLFSLMFVFQSMATAGNVEGTWIFKASNTPYEYSKGEIIIQKEGGEYQVVLSANYSKVPADKVVVDKNKVTFSLDIEGTQVAVILNIDGDTMTGKAESYEGTSELTGARKVSGGILGTWAYEADGTPYEYSKGEITIQKNGEEYNAVVAVNYSKLKVEKVEVDKNKASFSLYIEDTKVDVTLNVDGDKMTGKAESYEGTFALTGKRK